MEAVKNWAELIYYIAFILLTGAIVYYARRTYELESRKGYELLCGMVIHDATSAGQVTGYALEIYNAGNKVARNVVVSSNGKQITTIDFIKPNSSSIYPVGRILQALGERVLVGDESIAVAEGQPISITLTVDGLSQDYQVNSDIVFASRNTDSGSFYGIEKHLENIEKAIKSRH